MPDPEYFDIGLFWNWLLGFFDFRIEHCDNGSGKARKIPRCGLAFRSGQRSLHTVLVVEVHLGHEVVLGFSNWSPGDCSDFESPQSGYFLYQRCVNIRVVESIRLVETHILISKARF